MSSMFEGDHDWAPEDELDLGHHEDNNDGPSDHAHGQAHINGTSGPPPQDSMAHVEGKEEEEGEDSSPVVNNHHQQTTAVGAGAEDDDALPSSPPLQELGSVDERASTPDDTPSLQVGACFSHILFFF